MFANSIPRPSHRLVVMPVSLCLLITLGYTGSRFLGSSAHSGRKANAMKSTEAWSVSHTSITNGDGQQVIGNGNTIQATGNTHTQTSNKVVKHIEGKKCEGSGNAFDDGAAQVVCCFGDEIQCCGTAVAAVGALKSNNPSTKDGVQCSSLPAQTSEIQEKVDISHSAIHSNATGIRANDTGSGINVENPSASEAASLAFRRIAKCLASFDFVCAESGIDTLVPLIGSNEVGPASQLGTMPPGMKQAGANENLLALCWNTGQYFQCTLLCKNQLVGPDDTQKCNQAQQKLQQEDHNHDHNHHTRDGHKRNHSDIGINWLVVAQEAKRSIWKTKKVNGVQYSAKDALVKEVETHPNTPQAAQALYLLASFWSTDGLPQDYVEVTISGHTLDPKDLLEKALSIDPHYGDAWALLGDHGGGTIAGRHYTYQQCYQRAVELDASNPNIWFSVFHGLAEGDKIELRGKLYDKKRVLEQCLSLDPYRHQSFWTELALFGGGTVNKDRLGVKDCIIRGLKVNIRSPILWYMLAQQGGGNVLDRNFSVRQCLEQALIYTQDKRTPELQKVFPREISKVWRWLGNLGGATVRGVHYDKDECFEICEQEGMSVDQCWRQDDQVEY